MCWAVLLDVPRSLPASNILSSSLKTPLSLFVSVFNIKHVKGQVSFVGAAAQQLSCLLGAGCSRDL